MSNVFDMTKKELQAFLVAQGMKKFRADQIFHYIYKIFISKISFPGMIWSYCPRKTGNS